MGGLFHTHTKVRALRSRFCRETGLNPKVVILSVVSPTPHEPAAPPRPPGVPDATLNAFKAAMAAKGMLPGSNHASKEVLRNEQTFESYTGAEEVEVFLDYVGMFEEDYKGGML